MHKKGEYIKQLREQKNISQTELANAINVSKQTMYKYENDIITNIPSDKIELMAKLLGVSPCNIMGWVQPNNHTLLLSKSEYKIIDIYRNLNKLGQERLLEQAEDLSDLDKYKKCSNSEQDIG